MALSRPTDDGSARTMVPSPVFRFGQGLARGPWWLAVALLVTTVVGPHAVGDDQASVLPPPEPSRYPSTSTPVHGPQGDTLRRTAHPSRKTAAHVPEGAPVLAVWAGASRFDVPEPVDLFAHVAHEKQPIAVTSIRFTLVDGQNQTLAEGLFRDDGVAPDAEAGDRLYSARFDVPLAYHPPLGAQILLARVVAELKDRTSQRTAIGVSYGRSGGRLTGTFRDRLVDGNLVIAAEVEVETEARFHLEGVIYGTDGVAIGSAQGAAVLAPGRRELALSFYGLMFVERQLPGPYVLGSVMLRTTASPELVAARGPVLRDAHTTAAYELSELTHQEYAGPDARYVVPAPAYDDAAARDVGRPDG